MSTRRGSPPFSLAGNRAPPPGCRLRAVTIPPGCQLAVEAAEWAHALIVVELGELPGERGDLLTVVGELLQRGDEGVRWHGQLHG